jgi:hypothetical protein
LYLGEINSSQAAVWRKAACCMDQPVGRSNPNRSKLI